MSRIFSQDWFSHNEARWFRHLSHFRGQENLRFLEIGSFEGRSTLFMLDNFLSGAGSRVYCLDTWAGSYEHAGLDLANLFDVFQNNIQEYHDRVEIIRGFSSEGLLKPEVRANRYDFIYIDGCHEAKEVLEDAVLSFGLLKPGGVMIFDDYLWGDYINYPQMTPHLAVNSFLSCYEKHIEVLEKDYQVVVRKK